MGSYRISKILGELNIGLDTASDFLKEKGHDALKNRNAKIDQDQYDALVDQFASDKSKKVKAEELIEQKRIEREAIVAAREAEEEAKELIWTRLKSQLLKQKARLPQSQPLNRQLLQASLKRQRQSSLKLKANLK